MIGFLSKTHFTLRMAKIAMLGIVASMATLTAFNYAVDYGSHFTYLAHVMSMDTTYLSPAVLGRVITHPTLQHMAFIFIILFQSIVAFICWMGTWQCFKARYSPKVEFYYAKNIGILGLTLGILFWLVIFFIVGGQWFLAYQSKEWDPILSAFINFSVYAWALIFVAQHEEAR